MADVERRVTAFNLTLGTACARAGVAYGVWWRWRNGRSSPNLRSFNDAMSRMKAVLDAEEARLKQVLAGVA